RQGGGRTDRDRRSARVCHRTPSSVRCGGRQGADQRRPGRPRWWSAGTVPRGGVVPADRVALGYNVAHWPVLGPLTSLPIPASTGAGSLPEQDSGPFTRLSLTSGASAVALLVSCTGPRTVLPCTSTSVCVPSIRTGP